MEGITNHLHKLQSIHNEMNKAQQMLRDRVEKQIPHDVKFFPFSLVLFF